MTFSMELSGYVLHGWRVGLFWVMVGTQHYTLGFALLWVAWDRKYPYTEVSVSFGVKRKYQFDIALFIGDGRNRGSYALNEAVSLLICF